MYQAVPNSSNRHISNLSLDLPPRPLLTIAPNKDHKLSGNPEIIRWITKRMAKNTFKPAKNDPKSRTVPHVHKQYMMTHSQL